MMKKKQNLNWEDEDSSSLQMKKVVNKTVETSKDIKTEVNRNELFAGADTTATTKKQPAGTFKRRGPRPKKNTKPVALSQTDQEELNQIHDTDKLVDEGLDALGQELNDLMALSKAMGNEAKQQTTKLDSIYDGLENTDDKIKIVNKRAKLFTRTRRDRKQREQRFKKNLKEKTGVNPGVASAKMAVAANTM